MSLPIALVALALSAWALYRLRNGAPEWVAIPETPDEAVAEIRDAVIELSRRLGVDDARSRATDASLDATVIKTDQAFAVVDARLADVERRLLLAEDALPALSDRVDGLTRWVNDGPRLRRDTLPEDA
jgi:hypothetical protein